MTTTTMNRPAAMPMPGNAVASGWVPQSPLEWLEELRDEHERLVSAWKLARVATRTLGQAQADLRAEHDEQVIEAARVGSEPPSLPGRLDPVYVETQLATAAEAETTARIELDDCIARVASAVGAHRLGEEWRAATIAGDDLSPDDPHVAVAARLRMFEASWTWPTVWEPGPSLVELEAEVKAATELLQRLTGDADAELAAWREAIEQARVTGEDKPAAPNLDDELMARSHATTRLERAVAARDAAKRRGVIA